MLTGESVSRLSPYLHFGAISPREIEERLGGAPGARAFRRQVCWRDFYAHVLGHFPANAKSEFQERYRGMRWSRAEKRFAAWCEGRTGYPAVDAGMRQLRREGWIHNRARLVVGSFLTKDLGIDWRWGERWFMSASIPVAPTCVSTCPSWPASPTRTWPSRGRCPATSRGGAAA